MATQTPASETPRPANPPEVTTRPVAVIDIGTSSIRMAIAEIKSTGEVRTLETLSQAVTLGKDTFTQGFIGKTTIEECVRVLKSYRQKLQEYQIHDTNQMRVVATSAVREAENRLAFLDRIYIATGIQIEPLDEAEVSRITYHGIQPLLAAKPNLASAHTIVIEVGGGSSELLVMRNGNVEFSHTYRLGSLRLRKSLETLHAPAIKVRDIMKNQIDRTIEQVRQHVSLSEHVEMVALGGDVRFAVAQIDPDWNPNTLGKISVEALAKFTDGILKYTADELVQKYHLNFPDAETIGPALLTYVQFARAFQLANVLITNTNLRDGLLHEMAAREAWTDDFRQQIIRSVLDLGRKFNFDERHASHVAELSRKLFQAMRVEHQLDKRYELLLYLAALLYEIGMFVGHAAYHKHSHYLIRNSELFGLGKTDVLLIGLIARYHRRASPQPTHEGYSTLDRDQRVAVSKMAAILRVAIALDESRSQRIHELECSREIGQLVISVPKVEDLSLEQLAIRQSGTLFEEVYGTSVMLRGVQE